MPHLRVERGRQALTARQLAEYAFRSLQPSVSIVPVLDRGGGVSLAPHAGHFSDSSSMFSYLVCADIFGNVRTFGQERQHEKGLRNHGPRALDLDVFRFGRPEVSGQVEEAVPGKARFPNQLAETPADAGIVPHGAATDMHSGTLGDSREDLDFVEELVDAHLLAPTLSHAAILRAGRGCAVVVRCFEPAFEKGPHGLARAPGLRICVCWSSTRMNGSGNNVQPPSIRREALRAVRKANQRATAAAGGSAPARVDYLRRRGLRCGFEFEAVRDCAAGKWQIGRAHV